jgi:hypothetical protein
VIVVGLLAVSNDIALSTLKAKRWKRLQRLNYALFGLVVAHAIFYGALLRITSPSTLLLGYSVILVFLGQRSASGCGGEEAFAPQPQWSNWLPCPSGRHRLDIHWCFGAASELVRNSP